MSELTDEDKELMKRLVKFTQNDLDTQRTALLTKLREGVAEIYTYTKDPNYQHELILRHQVEALIKKLEAGE